MTDWTYQVTVAGVLGPALRAAFADLTVAAEPGSTVLLLRLPPGQGPADALAALHRRALVLLRLRGVADPLAAEGSPAADEATGVLHESTPGVVPSPEPDNHPLRMTPVRCLRANVVALSPRHERKRP